MRKPALQWFLVAFAAGAVALGGLAADDIRIETATFALTIGADGLRYLETELSKAAVIRAFAAAEME